MGPGVIGFLAHSIQQAWLLSPRSSLYNSTTPTLTQYSIRTEGPLHIQFMELEILGESNNTNWNIPALKKIPVPRANSLFSVSTSTSKNTSSG